MYNLARYVKAAKIPERIGPLDGLVPNQRSEPRIPKSTAKFLEFGTHPFRDQFDPTVGKIPDRTTDLETTGRGLGGVAETHALHLAGISHGDSFSLFFHLARSSRREPVARWGAEVRLPRGGN